MATKKSWWILFGIIVTAAWVLGATFQAGAETLNYKLYTYVTKYERVPIGDVEGHAVSMTVRNSFFVLESGEVATAFSVSTGDTTKGTGPFSQYTTITFPDGSIITTKTQGTVEGRPVYSVGEYASGGWTGEILQGTGRFQGIKGTVTSKSKFLPIEKGELGPKGIGEGTLTFTLPSK